MIEWKKWNRDLLPDKRYLVLYKGCEIHEAEPDTYKTDEGDAPIFVDREGNMLSRVTHYAEINFPESILVSETRPCSECTHFEAPLMGFPICKKKHMGVTRSMLVTYKADEGTCFQGN